jgi:tetratricopeptide (TPR) repeat protein
MSSTAPRLEFAGRRAARRLCCWLLCCECVLALCVTGQATAQQAGAALEEGESLFRAGKYAECAERAQWEIDRGGWNERWRVLKVSAELAQGKYADALVSVEDAIRRFQVSIPLRLLALDVYRYNGRPHDAVRELATLERVVMGSPQRFATPEGRIALGRFFIRTGADSRKVLDLFYDAAIKQQPDFVEAYLATAELGLEKQDFALAAETLRKAPKAAAGDPRYFALLARAYSAEDRAGSAKAIADALKINPRHVDSLILLADHLIDAEKYEEGEAVLKRIRAVNPVEARAWAYEAVLAHLGNRRDAETAARQSALASWKDNPEVDHLIGRKLSQKYRFAEGSAYQRRSLELDPEYQPAKLQLCQDLLRLGAEDEGWALAALIFGKDAYNVVAYNLTLLRDRLAGFRTLQSDGFIVRMEPREATLYGARVLEVLGRARKTLSAKYGAAVPDPVIVEIFPQKREFGVRTFGLPGADGLLGVCFGRVITANSPASQGANPANWEAVLWHEFCHVVTLSKTRNTMPRWLSEGISVYEEEQEDPAWATSLNPRFREMILGNDLTPLSQLSSAFLAPKTPLHLQFAYFESARAVGFLVKRFGLEALKHVLEDLGEGNSIRESLPRRTKMSLEQLDRDFARYARECALRVAAEATWEHPELPGDADSAAIDAWLLRHPKSFWGLRRLAERLVHEEKWQKAKVALEELKRLYPEYVGPENAYLLLAAVARRLADPAAERMALEELASRDGSASPAYLRMMELDESSGDWQAVEKNARRLLAVNPLLATPYRQLARAAEHMDQSEVAITAYRALSVLDDSDPAMVHFRLARLLDQHGERKEARREVLKSLEDAPRFLDAHRLLLEMVEREAKPAETPPQGPLPHDAKP